MSKIEIGECGMERNKEKKQYPIKHIVNCYFGNYCIKKCRDGAELEKARLCWNKLQEFAKQNPTMFIRHRDFVEMFADRMDICRFDSKERRRMPTWKEVVIKEGHEYPICRKFGIKRW